MNIALRKFKVQALTALHFSRDIIIVEATGSGKLTCFQLPALMLKDEEFCLVIVPTVALGWDHLKACEDLWPERYLFRRRVYQRTILRFLKRVFADEKSPKSDKFYARKIIWQPDSKRRIQSRLSSQLHQVHRD